MAGHTSEWVGQSRIEVLVPGVTGLSLEGLGLEGQTTPSKDPDEDDGTHTRTDLSSISRRTSLHFGEPLIMQYARV